jgi:class 3 adenylate cyclase
MARQEKTLLEWAGTEKRQVALVMTDIIGSTALAKGGDDKWVEMLKVHFHRARLLRDRFKGYEIKLIGDAYMAVFYTSDDALNFAKEFIVDTGVHEIFIRVAIHVGRIVIYDDDIYGIMVNYTARLIHSLDQRRVRINQPSAIAISREARSQIIAAHGEQIGRDFADYEADLKSFGRETACYYKGQDVILPVFARVKEINKAKEKAATPPSSPQLPRTDQSTDVTQTQERLTRPTLSRMIRPRFEKDDK